MKIYETLTDPATAEVLRGFATTGQEAILLGREFGGAVILTCAVPVPEDMVGWERLRALRHGPVGRLLAPGAEPPGDDPDLYPGDVVLLPEKRPMQEKDPGDWAAAFLSGDTREWESIPFRVV